MLSYRLMCQTPGPQLLAMFWEVLKNVKRWNIVGKSKTLKVGLVLANLSFSFLSTKRGAASATCSSVHHALSVQEHRMTNHPDVKL